MRHLYNRGELIAPQVAIIAKKSIPTTRKRLEELEEMNIIFLHGLSKNDSKELIIASLIIYFENFQVIK